MLLTRRTLVGVGASALLPSCALAQAANVDPQRRKLSEAITNMRLPHEVLPYGIEIKSGWHKEPFVVMGTSPYGSATPKWWPGTRVHKEWHSIAPWFTVYMGKPFTEAPNVGVEISGIECFVFLDSAKKWYPLRSQSTPSWTGAYNPNAVTALRKTGGLMLPGGGFLAIPTNEYMVHGGIPQAALPWREKADFSALTVTVRHRLRLIDPIGADNRQAANFIVMAGADYYPWVGAQVSDLGAPYNPGAGSGRFIKAGNDWRYSSVLLKDSKISDNQLLETPPPYSF